MTVVDQSELEGKIRDRPITKELEKLLKRAGTEVGVDRIMVYSGGQPGSAGKSTGGPRHNGGRAADLFLLRNGKALRFSNKKADEDVIEFIKVAATLGATGIGAAVDYMGPTNIHVGFGLNPEDHSRVVWGKDGKSANAPVWLRKAATNGWALAGKPVIQSSDTVGFLGRFEVIARSGLILRKGPGQDFGVADVFPLGQIVNVLGYSGERGAWAKVDLQGDNMIDGFMFADYLRAIGDDGHEA